MYTVIWSDEALDRLADIVVGADMGAQDRITTAVSAFNIRLTLRPHEEGESRSGTGRIAFIDLLAVGFWVDDDASIVRVGVVQRYGR